MQARSFGIYTLLMPRRMLSILLLAGLPAGLLAGILLTGCRRPSKPLPAEPMSGEPRLMLWAWEIPEDFTTLDPSKAGVAFLARELFLADTVQVRPRRQPLRVTPNIWLMADVRIETRPGFAPTPELRAQAVEQILAVLSEPNIRGLQIDFDATASERDFYAALLRDLRRQLPSGYPLSITALVSWCNSGSWLRSLPSGHVPVDEAVPMFFRMGGPVTTRATRPRSFDVVHEPLCLSSAGISTDEIWPEISREQRVYLFRPGSWTKDDLALVNALGYQGLRHIATSPTPTP